MGTNMYPQIINSILDNDLYAFTMGQAALKLYPTVITDDELIIRKEFKIPIPEGFGDELRAQICLMSNLKLSKKQVAFLKRRCYYLSDEFIEWLRSYRFDPKEVTVTQLGSHLEVRIHGRFCRTVYWETPLMALISELYYKMTDQVPDKNYILRAEEKGRRMLDMRAFFSEFGTRRRFSWEVQKNSLGALIKTAGRIEFGGVLTGTSNVQLAMDLDLNPMGTNAHKWYQLHMGLFGIRMANKMALKAWSDTYDTELGIALTDTFTTDVFLKDFNRHESKLYDGVRDDSEDYIIYTDKIVAHYKYHRIDPLSKTILFSDGLNIDLVEKIVAYCLNKIKCAFGIGTFLSNDIEGVEPLQIVIKQVAVYLKDGRKVWTVKLPDNPSKSSGNLTAQEHAKYELGIDSIYSNTSR